MSETITHTWQTVEQAAVTLNVSTRTVARRLANGSLESRVDENGRRLVLVQQINAAAVAEEAADLGVDDSALMPVDATATPVNASPQAVTVLTVLQSTVSAAREDARHARRTARWAWAGVGFMALLIVGGAAVVSSAVTRGTVTTDLLRGQLTETQSQLAQTQNELLATRAEAAVANHDLTAVRASEAQQRQQLAATAAAARRASVVPTATPTTQPSLIGRVVSLFGE